MQHFVGVLFCALLVLVGLQVEARSVAEYLEDRDRILELEDAGYLGSDLVLTAEETFANDYLMTHKVNKKYSASSFIKITLAGLLFFKYFLSQKQRVRPLGNCAPLTQHL